MHQLGKSLCPELLNPAMKKDVDETQLIRFFEILSGMSAPADAS